MAAKWILPARTDGNVMRILRKFSALTFVVVLILAAGCATNRNTKTAGNDSQWETNVQPTDKPTKTWQDYVEYSLLPLTIAGWMFGQAQYNPGIPGFWK